LIKSLSTNTSIVLSKIDRPSEIYGQASLNGLFGYSYKKVTC
jgi:hypothetical protein